VLPYGTPCPVGHSVQLAAVGVTDRPRDTLDQLIGGVTVLEVLGMDLLVHQDAAPMKLWLSRVGYNDDS
jgi:hypothetical protein